MGFFLLHPYYINSYPGLSQDVQAAQQLLGDDKVGSMLSKIPPGSIVIPRFRALPFGKELEQDVESMGSRLINSYHEHRSIADLFEWVGLLKDYTAPVYTIDDIPYLPEGEWFVKGETNSRKNQWFESCYAPNTKSLVEVVRSNLNDSLIGFQKLAIRPFQHFRQIDTAVDGRPVFHERRVFVYQGRTLSVGEYWSTQPDALQVKTIDELQFTETLDAVKSRVEGLAQFYVIDLAEYPDGHWGVVELNDGSMAGLSENKPLDVWGNLFADQA